ncbi:unnamed protein product [Polarella glacialis]|uniref:DNA 3'-5' helicase n=1 Tax=Polarella glacialis TaxID=89957 RepID=A0A813LRZ2_POLGL|nr:unnamed protein product [Polarella glacialis]
MATAAAPHESSLLPAAAASAVEEEQDEKRLVSGWVQRAPSSAVSHFPGGPAALCSKLLRQSVPDLLAVLSSFERRRAKGDRDPQLLSWMEVLAGLTAAQRSAASSPPDRALLLVACAGSGKTKTLLARVRWLLATGAAAASKVLLLSFSRAACDELRQRFKALDASVAAAVRVRTFHSFSLELLRAHKDVLLSELENQLQSADAGSCWQKLRRLQSLLSGEGDLRVISDSEQYQFVTAALETVLQASVASATSKSCRAAVTPYSAVRYVQRAKNTGISQVDDADPLLAAVFSEYESSLAEAGAVDFGDLVSCASMALASLPSLQLAVSSELDAVVVDEFQDTSASQLSLLKALLGDKPGRLTAVGDPRQRIFSFQGSCGGQFSSFKEAFGAQEFSLEENFRSTANICRCASAILGDAGLRDGSSSSSLAGVIARHPAGDGQPVDLVVCRTQACEEFHVQTWVLRSRLDGSSWRDLAVLARTTAAVRSTAAALRAVGVPVVMAGVEHYSRREMEDVLAMCRLALRPDDANLLQHCLAAVRAVSAQEVAVLEAAVRSGRQPPSFPSVEGADASVTARIARSLEGHPGRRSRFLLGQPQELSELLKELRAALFPQQRRRKGGVAGARPGHGNVSDSTLRAGLLLNGVAFIEHGAIIWPAPRTACSCRRSRRMVETALGNATATSTSLCVGCGGIAKSERCGLSGQAAKRTQDTDDAEVADAGDVEMLRSQDFSCSSCSGPLREGDPSCEACGRGHHIRTGVGCCGLPAARALVPRLSASRHSEERPPGQEDCQPWLCASCYSTHSAAWWSQRQLSGGFSAPQPRTAGGVLRRMAGDAPSLGLSHSTLWELCQALGQLPAAPPWLEPPVWKGVRRFARMAGDLVTRLAELRLDEFLARVFAVLPRGRRYRAVGARGKAKGLEEALKSEAEAHLREAAAASTSHSDDSAAAQLGPFLERLNLGSGACEEGPFAATAAGSGTAEAGRGRDAVTIATAHAAKGRQWPSVLAVRFNEGLGFPLFGPRAPAQACLEHFAEERRLAYVVASRACQRLTLSYALEAEGGRLATRSPFLATLGSEVRVQGVEFVDPADRRRLTDAVRRLSRAEHTTTWSGESELKSQAGSTSTTTEAWQDFLANPAKPPGPLGSAARLKRRLFPQGSKFSKGARGAEIVKRPRYTKAETTTGQTTTSTGDMQALAASSDPSAAAVGGAPLDKQGLATKECAPTEIIRQRRGSGGG